MSASGQGGIEKAKPFLDALYPTVGPVDLMLEAHEVFTHRCEIYPDSCDLLFDRGNSALQIAHLFTRLFDHGANRSQMLQHELVGVVSHGRQVNRSTRS